MIKAVLQVALFVGKVVFIVVLRGMLLAALIRTVEICFALFAWLLKHAIAVVARVVDVASTVLAEVLRFLAAGLRWAISYGKTRLQRRSA